MINVIIDNKIRVPVHKLPEELLNELKGMFGYNNPDFYKKSALGLWTGNTPKKIFTFEYTDSGQFMTFLKGSFDRIVELFKKYNLQYTITDKRYSGIRTPYSWDPNFVFRPYQSKAIDLCLYAECGLVEGAAGSGKTEIALGLIQRLGLKAAVIVHDTNLLNQWVRRISERLLIPTSEIGIFGGGKKKIGKQITVVMYQTARNNMHRLKEQFGIVIADEIHHAPSNTFLKVLQEFNSRYIYGFSATLKRQDLKHFISYDLFGPVIYKITREDLVDQGYLTDVQMHVVYTDYYFDFMNEDQLQELAETEYLPLENMTVNDKKQYLKENNYEHKDYGKYLDHSCQSTRRNEEILNWIYKEYKANSTSIVFVRRRKHCTILQNKLKEIGIDSVILWGAQGKEKKEITERLKMLKDGTVKIGIGTVLDEGIDLPRVDAGFITYRNSTHPGQQEQQAGRLARLFEGKSTGKLYYFFDHRVTKFQKDIVDIKSRFKNIVIHAAKKRS